MLIKSDIGKYPLLNNILKSFIIHYIMQPLQIICIVLNITVMVFFDPNILTYISVVLCSLAFILNVKSASNYN